MTATKSEWYFIVNPRAGSGKTMSEWVPAERKLEKLGIPYVTAYTDYKNHATHASPRPRDSARLPQSEETVRCTKSWAGYAVGATNPERTLPNSGWQWSPSVRATTGSSR